MTQSFAQLKQAQAKFSSGIEALKPFSAKNADKQILVPLTQSLYVPGELADVETVMVDVGTGYFVEKSVKDATDFYKRKVDFLKQNLEKLQETVNQRQNQRSSVIDMIQVKFQMLKQESEAAKTTTTAAS